MGTQPNQVKCLKTPRDDGYLAYSREGNKYWYRRGAILSFLCYLFLSAVFFDA